MKKHVLVMALSVFAKATKCPTCGIEQTRMFKNTYCFNDPSLEGQESTYTYSGYYQLEPIPIFIKKRIDSELTDIILLETPQVRDPECYGRKHIFPAPDHSEVHWPADDGKATEVMWFKEFLGLHLPGVKVHDVEIEPHNQMDSLKKTMDLIRTLYKQTEDPVTGRRNPEDWRLWMDTHGGFRDTFLVIASAARFLAMDDHDNIPTHGVFSVLFSQQQNEPSEIVNQTAFYFTRTAEALSDYLNYGQYLMLEHVPYAGTGPYAFISYRHKTEALIGVRAVFRKMEEAGLDYWFDDGIKTGEEWAKALAEKNDGASLFVAMICGRYFESAECWKELVRAIAGVRAGKKLLRLIQLQSNVDIPKAVPSDAAFDPVRELQRALGVTDADIAAVLDEQTNFQHTQLYKYMPGNKEREVNERNFVSDTQLTAEFEKLSKEMNAFHKRIAAPEDGTAAPENGETAPAGAQ